MGAAHRIYPGIAGNGLLYRRREILARDSGSAVVSCTVVDDQRTLAHWCSILRHPNIVLVSVVLLTTSLTSPPPNNKWTCMMIVDVGQCHAHYQSSTSITP